MCIVKLRSLHFSHNQDEAADSRPSILCLPHSSFHLTHSLLLIPLILTPSAMICSCSSPTTTDDPHHTSPCTPARCATPPHRSFPHSPQHHDNFSPALDLLVIVPLSQLLRLSHQFSVAGWYNYTSPELALLPPLLQCREDNISDLVLTSLHSSSPTLPPSSSNTS